MTFLQIVHDFVKKLKFFHVLSLSKIDEGKLFAEILHKKETFEDYKKQLFMKNAKLEFFQRG